MKLRKEHFVKEKKPEIEQYGIAVKNFESDLKEWERKYIKSTPKWKKFSEEKPITGQHVYLASEDEFEDDSFCQIVYYKSSISCLVGYDYWASVEEHKEDLKHFEENQQIFEGWKFVESNSKDNPYYNGEEHFIKGVSMITIHDKGFCVSKDHITIYYGKNGPNAVEILKLICKDNSIEL